VTETCLVRVLGAANGGGTPHDGRYVVNWNPDTEAGTLELTSTGEAAEARRFPFPEVFNEWKRVSRVQPLRPWDGKPNRPLTGIHIEIVRQQPV
jgi:hypothetical protein